MLLYRNAPSIGSIGGWDGFSLSQICARLTNQSEIFWEAHVYECEDLVKSRFSSFAITGQIVLYFILMFRLLNFGISLFLNILGRRFNKNKSQIGGQTNTPFSPKHNVILCLGHPTNLTTCMRDDIQACHSLECGSKEQ